MLKFPVKHRHNVVLGDEEGGLQSGEGCVCVWGGGVTRFLMLLHCEMKCLNTFASSSRLKVC